LNTARINVDVASNSIIMDGAKTVFVNDQNSALLGSVNGRGSVVIAGSQDVYIEDREVARLADTMSDGGKISTGSLNVFTN
jgi:uncharacterized Zn-binding protein involved in type VI secretion